ncbi:unnamed protein product [Arabidopsis halleri]
MKFKQAEHSTKEYFSMKKDVCDWSKVVLLQTKRHATCHISFRLLDR